jgi:hypothetical protein
VILKPIQGLFVLLLLSGGASGQPASTRDARVDQAPMRADTKTVAQDFFMKPNSKAFAFPSEKGTYWAAWGSSSVEAARELAMHECEERTGTPCMLFAVNDQIVWQPEGEHPTGGAPRDKPPATSIGPR